MSIQDSLKTEFPRFERKFPRHCYRIMIKTAIVGAPEVEVTRFSYKPGNATQRHIARTMAMGAKVGMMKLADAVYASLGGEKVEFVLLEED